MGKIILVTGGSRSGKSSFAESLLKEYDDVLYIATAIVTDEEMEDRIKKHREGRNIKWGTFEGYRGLKSAVYETGCRYIMLDCITVMVTNLMFEENRDFDTIKAEEIEVLEGLIMDEIRDFIKAAREKGKTLVMVTNEVGCGLVPEYRLGRIFRDIAGRVNQMAASLSDEVYLTACGLPLRLK